MYRVDCATIFNGYKFVNIGMLFDEETQLGISPDGLLLNDTTKDIIPIEIKCIRQPKILLAQSNIREIKMARIQLTKVKQILNKSNIIVFLYIYNNNSIINIKCEYSII